jgi:hypothetical protein
METPREYYYTYYSYEEWGRGYFGSRKCYCLPEEDVKYLGSFCDKRFKPTQKIILKSDYVTREEAYADEIILQEHYKVVENPHFANKSYQTSTKFYVPTDRGIENGKRLKELNIGIHSLTPEQKIENGRKGAQKAKEIGAGFYSIPYEQRVENAKKGGKISGKKTKKLKIGIHKLSKEQRIENGKKGGMKNKQNKTGVCGLTKEQRSEAGKKGGKITAETHRKNKTGIFSLTFEQRSENGKKYGVIGASKGGKKTSSQKWQCTETGHITNAGALTNYQRKRGIDTTKRIRIE